MSKHLDSTESPLMRRVLLHASRLGLRLFRNQVGVYQLKDGRYLRSGLCIGSSDLVGWTPVVITPDMVGKTIAVFTACETKAGRKQATDEQVQFILAVQTSGGLARVIRAESDIDTLIATQEVNRELFRAPNPDDHSGRSRHDRAAGVPLVDVLPAVVNTSRTAE